MATPSTATHAVGSRDEWLTARLALLEAEKELTRRNDELVRQRQQLPWVPIERDYRFDTDDGPASLADLFRGRSQLIVFHFMFAPSWDAGCPSCSSVADGYDGSRIHWENHDVALATVSRAPLAKLQAYRERMGWGFPWASSYGSDFNVDFGVSFTRDALAQCTATYNFGPVDVDPAGLPDIAGDELVDDAESQGISTFVLEDGVVYHAYSAYARGADAPWTMYAWLDRAPFGRNEGDGPRFRRHDEYDR